MQTIMSAATNIVNRAAAKDRLRLCQDRVVNLPDRIRWVLDATGMSAREWSKRAGLSHAVLSEYMRRARADENASIKLPQLTALARAAGVSLAWLADGEGESGLRAVDTGQQPGLRLEYVERYPSRREAAEAMAGLIRQDAIVGVLRWNLHNEEDPGMAWWIERMKELARQADLRDKSPAAVEQDKQRGLADTERVRAALAAARKGK